MRTRKQSFGFLVLLCVSIVLSACASVSHPSPSEFSGTSPSTQEQVENIFTLSTSEPQPETSPNDTLFATISHGFRGDPLINDLGRYDIYNGGEMHISYHFDVMGGMRNFCLGLLLILDGRPQPYKTAEDASLAWMHTFIPTTGELEIELIFTPVTGKSGDTLELSAFYVVEPDYYYRGDMSGFMQTNGTGIGTTQLQFQADPPPQEELPVPERVVNQTITYTDLTSDEIIGWSPEKLQKDFSFLLTTDHISKGGWTYAVTAEDGIKVTAEVFGNPMVKWSLILYVDHLPVSVLPENQALFQTRAGQKTIIETTLDLSDFDGEEIFYAVLYARNWRGSAVSGTNCGTVITPTYYLTDAVDLDSVHEKYR